MFTHHKKFDNGHMFTVDTEVRFEIGEDHFYDDGIEYNNYDYIKQHDIRPEPTAIFNHLHAIVERHGPYSKYRIY